MADYFPGRVCRIGLATLVLVAAVIADVGIAVAQGDAGHYWPQGGGDGALDWARGGGTVVPPNVLSSGLLNDGETVITLERRAVELTKEMRREFAKQAKVKESELNYSQAELRLVATIGGKSTTLRSDIFVHKTGDESLNVPIQGFHFLGAAMITDPHPGDPLLLVLTSDGGVKATVYKLDRQGSVVQESEACLEINQWSSTGDIASGATIEETAGGILVRLKHRVIIDNVGGRNFPDKFRYTQYVAKVQVYGAISWKADPKNYKKINW